jgi:GxxExxY protein
MIINDKVIVEIKSIEVVGKAQKKQVLTYLKLTGMKLGFLLNFGEAMMKNGIYRIINGIIV